MFRNILHYNHSFITISWLVISNIINSLSHWGILVILVKFFSTEDVGFFTYGTAIAAPIFMLTEMQMKSVLVVEPENNHDYFHTYHVIRLLSTSIALFGLITYCFLYNKVNWIVVFVIIYKSAESMVDIIYGYLQKKDKMVLMSKIMILKTILTLIICFLITIFFYSINMSLASIIFVSVLFYLMTYFFICQRLFVNMEKISFSVAIDILKKCMPLGVSVLFGSYITNYPRIILESYCGPEILAYFGSYSYLVIGIFQISSPITTFLRQRLSVSYQNNNIQAFRRKIRLSTSSFILLGVVFFLGFYLFGDFIITILYKDSYTEYGNVIYYLILAQLLLTISGIFSTAILSFNIYTKQAVISFAIFCVVLIVSHQLISNYGIYGGAFVSIIAALISISCYSFLYYKRICKWVKDIESLC